jgi:thymidylate synthase
MIKMTIMTEENQYLDLIRNILANGSVESSRSGQVKSIFGHSMRFSLRDGQLPLLTSKKVAWKTCFKELQWFLRGSTNNNELRENGVHIWDGNSSREFLDNRGLNHREEGDLGPIYGFQWRHYDASYVDCNTDYTGQGIDQLAEIIRDLRDPIGRTSRRLIMTAWNPNQLSEMALPPCHILAQFNVRDGKYLSCALYQRSGDVGLGIPFNIASYSFLTHILAKHCGLEAEEFVYFLGNCHIYEDHIESLTNQIDKSLYPFPKIRIMGHHLDISEYSIEDIEWIEPYICNESIKMKMAI